MYLPTEDLREQQIRSAAAERSRDSSALYDEEKQRQLERDTKREMILRKRDEDFDQRHPFPAVDGAASASTRRHRRDPGVSDVDGV